MKPMDSINVIPFIDIMLVLLAIVLTTATFIAQGKIEVELPKAKNAQAVSQSLNPVELTVDKSQKLYYNGEPVEPSALGERLASVSKDTPIILRVDSAAPFASFISVVDELKARHLEKLSIITRKTE